MHANASCWCADAHDKGHHKMKLSAATTLMFGAAAGVAAEIVTYPLEVIRRKMQLERTMAARRILQSPTGARAAAARLVRPCPRCCPLSPIKQLTRSARWHGRSLLRAPAKMRCRPGSADDIWRRERAWHYRMPSSMIGCVAGHACASCRCPVFASEPYLPALQPPEQARKCRRR